VTANGLEWTRGEPKRFASSNVGRRGFCAACGTPLTYEYEGGVDVAIGALDDPTLAPPTVQLNPTDKLPIYEALHTLPGRPPEEAEANQAYLASVASHQHPDHDTANWPPKARHSND
jgi:hypothetical protein